MVLKHPLGVDLVERYPKGARRVLAAADFGEGGFVSELDQMSVGDGPAPVRPLGIVKHFGFPD